MTEAIIKVNLVDEKKRLFWKPVVRYTCILLIPFFLAVMAYPKFRLIIDVTGSVGGGVFLVLVGDKNIHLFDPVLFDPPANRYRREHFAWIKYVGGVPGDVIEKEGRTFYNKEFEFNLGTAKMLSLQGNLLTSSIGGIVPDDHYYVYSPHVDGFDSRYADIGFIRKESVIGKAIRLF